MDMQKWSVKSDALLTMRSCDSFNGLKRGVATNWPITENCLLMFKDKRLNMLARWQINILKFSSKVKNNLKFT